MKCPDAGRIMVRPCILTDNGSGSGVQAPRPSWVRASAGALKCPECRCIRNPQPATWGRMSKESGAQRTPPFGRPSRAGVRIKTALSFLLMFAGVAAVAAEPIPVRIVKQGDGYSLLRGGRPYFVKGAVGSVHLEELVAAGGNSIRASVNDLRSGAGARAERPG